MLWSWLVDSDSCRQQFSTTHFQTNFQNEHSSADGNAGVVKLDANLHIKIFDMGDLARYICEVPNEGDNKVEGVYAMEQF